MTQHRSLPRDDENDTQFFEEWQNRVIETCPNPQRIGCFDQATLEELFFSPERLDLRDLKYLHIVNCAECSRVLKELRLARREQFEAAPVESTERAFFPAEARRWAAMAAIVCIVGVVAFVGFSWRHPRRTMRDDAETTAIAETIDLTQQGTSRGSELTHRQENLLPRRLITLRLLLPYYSAAGNYSLAISSDPWASSVRARAHAYATRHDSNTELSVTLDLRDLKPGNYYLVTQHEADSDIHSYPLTLR